MGAVVTVVVGTVIVMVDGGKLVAIVVVGMDPIVGLKIKLLMLRLVVLLEPNRSFEENGIGVGLNDVVVVAKLLNVSN